MLLAAEIGSPATTGDAIRVALVAVAAGAHIVKGQLYRRETLTTRTALTYGKGLGEPEHQWDNFPPSNVDWPHVAQTVKELGARFALSVFDPSLVDDAAEYCDLLKVASADITYRDLIERAAGSGLPVVMSTGAATEKEITRAVGWAGEAWKHSRNLTLLACTLSYPTPAKFANLHRIHTLRQLTGLPVGYSDHTQGWEAMVRADQWGAVMLEKHFTCTPGQGGDHDFAATSQTFYEYHANKRYTFDLEWLDGDPRLVVSDAELTARACARRSWTFTRSLPAGHEISVGDVIALRPGGGIPPFETVIGRTLARPVEADEQPFWETFTPSTNSN